MFIYVLYTTIVISINKLYDITINITFINMNLYIINCYFIINCDVFYTIKLYTIMIFIYEIRLFI